MVYMVKIENQTGLGLRVAAIALAASFVLAPGAPLSALAAPPPPATKSAPAKPAADKAGTDKGQATPKVPEMILDNIITVTPDELVGKPQEFLGKNVKFNANFYAFSNLGLDYKPAYRSSKTHLSFLVLKPTTHIPLSELKLAMMIPKEKDPESTLLAALKDGDQLELTGKVFSTSLDDPWVEIFKLKKIGGSPDDKKTVASGSDDATDKKGDKSDAKDAKTDSKSDNKSDGKSDTKTDGKSDSKSDGKTDGKGTDSAPATK